MDNSAARKFERKVLLIVAIIVVIGTLFLSLVNFIANFLWFKEMEYLDVFFKQLVTQLTVGVPTFVIVTVLVYLYLNHLRKGYFKQIASGEETNMKGLRRSTAILAVIFGIGATFFAVTQLWFEILKFAKGYKGKTLVVGGHPVCFFGMALMKMLRRLSYLYWIGDYFPNKSFVIRAFEWLKRFFHNRMPFTYYLSDAINRKMREKNF